MLKSKQKHKQFSCHGNKSFFLGGGGFALNPFVILFFFPNNCLISSKRASAGIESCQSKQPPHSDWQTAAGGAWMTTRRSRTCWRLLMHLQSEDKGNQRRESIPGLQDMPSDTLWRLLPPFRLGWSNESATLLKDWYYIYIFFLSFWGVWISHH